MFIGVGSIGSVVGFWCGDIFFRNSGLFW